MAEPISATEYAHFEKTDAATYFGARLAMGKALRTYTDAVANGETPDKIETLKQAALDSPYLKAAGTGELVGAYFESVVNRDGVDIDAFVKEVNEQIPREDLDKMLDKAGEPLGFLDQMSAGRHAITFNNLAAKHLKFGILGDNENPALDKTFTRDFRDALQKATRADGKPITDGISIKPTELREVQLDELTRMHGRLMLVDPFSPPQVGHLISSPEKLPHQLQPQAEIEQPPAPHPTDKQLSALKSVIEKANKGNIPTVNDLHTQITGGEEVAAVTLPPKSAPLSKVEASTLGKR